MFAFSCKQANSGEGQKPDAPIETNEVTITVKGDEGVIIKDSKTIKTKKSSTWKDIKQKVIEKIKTKENKEIKEWRIKDVNGKALQDDTTFEKDATVFAITKDKEQPKPPIELITVTIEADAGYTFKESKKPCIIEVEKNLTWASIKTQAEAKIELKEDYESAGWKLGGKDGSYIEDSAVFDENALIFATSKKKDEPDKPKITITVKGDEEVEIGSPDNFTVDSGSKWVDIKTQAEEKAKAKENFEINEWHLNNKDGELIGEDREFKENTTVFAVSKRKVIGYKVEHLKENIEDEDYTKTEEEAKTGEAGKNTSAEAKQYEGFSCQGLAQSVIKADGSTVVQIKYKRNIVSLILDLDGGSTTTTLKNGEGGKKLLEGKFEARVEVKGLEKENYGFEKWEPALPQTFPATSSNTIHKAKWKRGNVIITVKGDENVNLSSPNTVSVAKGAKWADIKTQVMTVATPKEFFEIKEWHLNNKDGEAIKDETEFKENTTVFAVSNRKVIGYKVEHLKENIENAEYTVSETEAKTGEAGKNTSAEAKQYEGFSCQGLAQSTIKADGSTVVQIKYERNRVSLILDLAGGSTTTTLKDGEAGKKLLEGKFEARVEVKDLERENFDFEKWVPELPQTFPATSSNTIHKAKWKRRSVTITVKGDEGIEIASPDNFTVDKGLKWVDIKTQAQEKAKVKAHFELLEWHLTESTGTLITDETEFKENATVFAVSREKPKAKYRVWHYQQNLEDEEYAKKETEEKEGFVGEETRAEAKQYPGFTADTFKQKEIKADGKTVVRILYKRNIVSLIIDLKGGKTTTELQDGADGKKLLSGKFEGEVSIKTPTKQGVQFEGWEPELPTNFPANDETVYTAKWGAKTAYRVTIEGDERVKVAEPQYIDVPIGSNKTIGEIRSEIEAKVSLKAGWQAEDYCFYDWRMGGEKGEEMLDATQITEDITVYARTNYKRFKLSGTILEGYEGEKPRGRIFIPKTVEIIKEKAFNDCDGLKAVDLSGCTELKEIEWIAFYNCTSLENIDLSPCSKLTKIGQGAFRNCSSLESIDLSPCIKLTEIGHGAFSYCSKLKSVDLSGCAELTLIGGNTFSDEFGVFKSCSSLESIDLSPCNKLKKIGKSAFEGCSNLKTVNLNGCAEMTDIKNMAFSGCANLESIDLSACTKLASIGNSAFEGCDKAEVKLPANLTQIGSNAFGENSSTYCKEVLVPSVRIKNLVENSGYPEERIEMY